ncbi:MAG: pyridoxamine 5'-phosphate oxidase family protein [Acidimicrobiia bacterium]
MTDARDQSACWGEFARGQPDLATFGRSRLTEAPAYLATVRKSGAPRVHPVTPIFTESGLYLFMEPTSPKGRDIRERELFAMHNGVPDNAGTGGEFHVVGRGFVVEDPAVRSSVAASAGYEPAERYVLFELHVAEARCNGYGDVRLPTTRAWVAGPVRS